MCLLGGARRSEPTVIEWRHVLADRIVFDPETTKMGRGHAVPRTRLIDEVLADAKSFRQATSALVFPGKRGSPFGGFTKSVAKLIERAGVAKFTLHDLRRTLRTIMSRCGYDNEIQRLCVGQKSHGIDAIYNLDEQWQIRKMAFEAAHAYITAVIRGCSTDSVVWMQRASNPQNRFKAQLLERLRERCE
jgi:integrase